MNKEELNQKVKELHSYSSDLVNTFWQSITKSYEKESKSDGAVIVMSALSVTIGFFVKYLVEQGELLDEAKVINELTNIVRRIGFAGKEDQEC